MIPSPNSARPTSTSSTGDHPTRIHPAEVGSAGAERLAYFGIVVLALVVVGVVAWTLPRGFDITDEGFYLLSYRFPAEYEASFTNFHLVVTRVFGLADASILTYRVVGLLAALLGGTLFGLSLAAWLRAVVPPSPRRWLTSNGLVTGFVLLGTLLSYSITPRTLSYNTLNTLALLLTAAAVLTALRQGPTGAGWLLAAGGVLGLDAFVKVSTSIFLVLSAALVVGICWRRAGAAVLLRATGWLLLGLLLGLGLYFLRAQSPSVWWHNFRQEMVLIRSIGYGTDKLLLKYIFSIGNTLWVLVWPLGPVLVVVSGVALWWRQQVRTQMLALVAFAVLGGAGLGLIIIAVRHRWYYVAYMNQLEILPLLISLLLMGALAVVLGDGPLVFPTAASPRSEQRRVVAGWLAVLPLLAAAGTYNDLRINLLIDVAPWFGLLLVVFTWPRSVRLPTWVVPAFLFLPAGLVVEQVVWGTMQTPYGLTTPITVQTEPLHAAGVQGLLRLDARTVEFMGQLEKLLARAGFRPGDPLLGFHGMPGLVYLCGGVSPGAPWYFKDVDVRTCHSLNITRLPLRQACILLGDSLEPGLQRCMREQGLRFPEKYRLVGELQNAFLNHPNEHRQTKQTIKVYAPLESD